MKPVATPFNVEVIRPTNINSSQILCYLRPSPGRHLKLGSQIPLINFHCPLRFTHSKAINIIQNKHQWPKNLNVNKQSKVEAVIEGNRQ